MIIKRGSEWASVGVFQLSHAEQPKILMLHAYDLSILYVKLFYNNQNLPLSSHFQIKLVPFAFIPTMTDVKGSPYG